MGAQGALIIYVADHLVLRPAHERAGPSEYGATEEDE